MSPRATSNATVKIRYYLWAGGQAWRISNRLITDLVERKARFPQYANTIQRIIELSVEQQLERILIRAINGTAFAFDREGALNLSDQADALGAIFSMPVAEDNVLDIQGVIRGRQWLSEHTWQPGPELMRILEADLRAEQQKTRKERLPSLKSAKPREH